VIYLDACALLKFIKPEAESAALRKWRESLPGDIELITSELARLEITRALLRAGVDHQQVPYFAGQAVRGVYLVDLTTTVLSRAMAYRTSKLGSLDAIHLASAEPFREDLGEFLTYDKELAGAAEELGFPVSAPA
jgi:predicted nucleic acid-binding protein